MQNHPFFHFDTPRSFLTRSQQQQHQHQHQSLCSALERCRPHPYPTAAGHQAQGSSSPFLSPSSPSSSSSSPASCPQPTPSLSLPLPTPWPPLQSLPLCALLVAVAATMPARQVRDGSHPCGVSLPLPRYAQSDLCCSRFIPAWPSSMRFIRNPYPTSYELPPPSPRFFLPFSPTRPPLPPSLPPSQPSSLPPVWSRSEPRMGPKWKVRPRAAW